MIFKFYWRPILWAFFIAFLCGMPGKDIPKISWLEWISFDKWVHAGMFFVLNFLFLKSYLKQKQSRENLQNSILYFAIACILYGGILELLQGLIFIDRSADMSDFAANSFGVILSVLFLKKRITL
jgi:VanZ family protein